MSTRYEQQIIGQFFMELGFELCKQGRDIKGLANLFQQTPVDPALSDFVGATDEVYFLIEFKREKDNSERRKKGIREEIRFQLKNHFLAPLQGKNFDMSCGRASAQCHWLATGNDGDEGGGELSSIH